MREAFREGGMGKVEKGNQKSGKWIKKGEDWKKGGKKKPWGETME